MHHPRSTRLKLADLDTPLRDHVPGSLQQGHRPDRPAVDHTKWLVAALAIRRSHCHATPGHLTSQRKLGLTVNSVMGKLN